MNNTTCPPVYPLRILARKWSYFVLRTLRAPRGFSELQRELPGITNHILTRELKLLQGEKLIVSGDKYCLAPAGSELLSTIAPLEAWTAKYHTCVGCSPDKRCATCPGYPSMVRSVRRKNTVTTPSMSDM